VRVTLEEIQAARRVLTPHLPPTPLVRNAWLSELMGCELHLKLENMQPIGSFKIRGASYRISRLTAQEKRKGVVAASAGNHAQGVAWGSRVFGTHATIVMPRGAPLLKIQNTRTLGAEVILEGDSYDEAFAFARNLARKSGKVYVPAFEDADVIAGQGTVALELLEQLPDAEVVVGSMGGGGLMAGVSVVMSALRPKLLTVGCQASGAASLTRSIRKGRAITLSKVETFADGIAVGVARESMRKLLAGNLGAVAEADDEAIAAAVLMLIEKAKVVSEGAGALPLAVLEKLRSRIRGKKVVAIISGGNIDVNVLSRIIDRGLIRAGRRLRINVLLSDRPGSLARLTALIAQHGANVIQAIHDRSEPSTTIDLTEVALTLETRGKQHSEEVIRALKDQVVRLELTH
jgi:threonine dehydratase